MKKTSKILITTIAVIGISAGTLSVVSAKGGWGGYCDRYEQSQEYGERQGKRFGRSGFGNMEQKVEKKLDYMKYQLKITEDQEPAWQELEALMKEKANMMSERFKKGDFKGPMPVKERVTMMREGADHMNQMADAIDKLYAQLTPEQQATADEMRPFRRMR